MFSQFLQALWSSISSMIDMLKDSRIAGYMFDGVTLWSLLIAFFCGWLLIRFFLNPFGGGGLLTLASRPQESYTVHRDPDSNSSDSWGVKMR